MSELASESDNTVSPRMRPPRDPRPPPADVDTVRSVAVA
jgi:hypothetical protein